ncbi:hypothetical protein [Streptomyces cavernae]|uniref:hypothetical protein n=1 Tax=Streptomyces cavernae TaxID=2259034 RepID=UPI000FEBFA22|nr:hypothetical protein [Streptomyces cavernae]
MSDHVSFLQMTGVAALTAAGLVWGSVLLRVVRRRIHRTGQYRHDRYATGPRPLRALPRQAGPPPEAVQLTAAERAAFAGLVRQFSEGRS